MEFRVVTKCDLKLVRLLLDKTNLNEGAIDGSVNRDGGLYS
jgi:hypothetical protein